MNSAPSLSPAMDQRYVQERLLGRGAMGAVYLVRDRETGERLAIKKLLYVDAFSVLRLKREFRAVADMSHPNLVKVYELGHGPDGYFLAMEYVEGQDLQKFLGHDPAMAASFRIEAAVMRLRSHPFWLKDVLLPTFYQLALGVDALHHAGMLHRDLKPSNVLVEKRRVVVLDFGLIRALHERGPALTEDGSLAGTPAYMAPEQALGKPLCEASDWFAFGAILYEALTGVLPHDGTIAELLRDKLEREPKRPETFNPAIPTELGDLCMALLSREPGARPRAADILRSVSPAAPPSPGTTVYPSSETSVVTETQAVQTAPFFGRTAEVNALYRVLQAAEAGHCQVAHVRGISGAGKSALVEHFLNELEFENSATVRATALVLRSRCYEREAMPFKALDGVIDALSRHLATLDDLEVSHLLPADLAALVRVFPALERLRAVQRLLNVRSIGGDSVQTRQRAELALHDLFGRMAKIRPVVIWIDDVQWGDLDSAAVVQGFLQRALGLPLLLILSYRREEVETSECLKLLLAATQQGTSAPVTVVDVTSLGPDDMFALCREQLGAQARGREELLRHIVSEADGSPFLAAQLTALAQAKLALGDADLSAISLSELIAQTGALLPSDARRFLEVLAIAGRPIAPKLALRAAGLRRGGREIVHVLRKQLLVRTRDVGGDKLIEVYHDRVRESVQRAIDKDDAQRLHDRLLQALEHSGHADPDWLYAHAVGAGQPAAALRYGLTAAARAMNTLAFGHAARLYRSCLELSEASEPERSALVTKLAEALAYSGRGSQAADAYLEAASLAGGNEGARLMRLATSHLFRSGRFEEAERILPRVLSAVGIRMPSSPLGVLAALLWDRFCVAVRGLGFKRRTEAEIPREVLDRIDTVSALRIDVQSLDSVRAAWFMWRALRWALAAGEPKRVFLSLCGVCSLIATSGARRTDREAQRVLKHISSMAGEVSAGAAHYAVARALSSFMRMNMHGVLAPASEAERLCREGAVESDAGYYLRFSAASIRIGALYALGDFRAFAVELDGALSEARATENEAALLSLAWNETLKEEIEDCSEASVARLIAQRDKLSKGGFGLQHALHMIAVCVAACNSGRYAWGLELLNQDWQRFVRSPVRFSIMLATSAHRERARLVISDFGERGTGSRALDEIRVHARRPSSNANVVATRALARARLAYIDGDVPGAIALMRKASTASLPTYELPKKYTLGRLMGGDEGAALSAEAEWNMLERGVVNPRHFVRGFFPELFRKG
jgi:hypothetical protein